MIIVLVPELEAMLAEAERVPRRLRAWLARATENRLDPHHHQSQLVCGQALSPAALSRRVDCPGDSQGHWLRADPIELRPDLNAVWIQAGVSLDRNSAVFADLRALFEDAGLEFDLPHPQRGYLRLDQAPDCRFEPPWLLAGHSLDHVLPRGPEQARWRRLLNECQILLHQAGAGQDGALPQGLWFWGEGSLPDRAGIRARVSHLAGDDPLLAALADWLKLSWQPDCPVWPADHSLLLWSADSGRSADQNLSLLDRWLTPAWRRLRRFGVDQLELASMERAWSLSAVASWRFWQTREAVPA
jgi:hypothetical protein